MVSTVCAPAYTLVALPKACAARPLRIAGWAASARILFIVDQIQRCVRRDTVSPRPGTRRRAAAGSIHVN